MEKVEECHNEASHQPQAEPCKFCGKAFHTWEELIAHLPKHMETISLPILRLVEKFGDLQAAKGQFPNRRDGLPTSMANLTPCPEDTMQLTTTPVASLKQEKSSTAPTDSGYASMGQALSGVAQAVHDDPASYLNDAATEYTDASSVATWRKESYISDFADDLFGKIQEMKPDEHELDRISELLPDLLRGFALRLGYNAPTRMHSDVMYFVHKYRTVIADAFKKKKHQEESLEEEDNRMASHDDKMPLDELMSSWFQGQDVRETYHPRSQSEQHDTDMDSLHSDDYDLASEEKIAVPMGYRDFVLETESFQWLLAHLQSELRLSATEPKTIETIRREIVSSLRSTHILSERNHWKSIEPRSTLNGIYWATLNSNSTSANLPRPLSRPSQLQGLLETRRL
ncbi:hypothetical protein GGR57DRAFT_506471 [Xylariaceae sp. FL1272]|nr:hypothetical protein GGR57DRAFT_506471 [Xylariaceae sp. FL1272]